VTDLYAKDEGDFVLVAAATDAGTDWLDRYNPVGVDFLVIDSGRIALAAEALPALELAAKYDGVEVSRE
jgi:hypothetical protein